MMNASLGRMVRIAVYMLLVASAGATFLFGDMLWDAARQGEMPHWAALVGPCAFTLFVIIYAYDRRVMVKRRQLALGRAISQIAFAIIFLAVLWPGQAQHLKEARQAQWRFEGQELERLLDSKTPIIRALACEVVAARKETGFVAKVERIAQSDRDARVRGACARAMSASTESSNE